MSELSLCVCVREIEKKKYDRLKNVDGKLGAEFVRKILVFGTLRSTKQLLEHFLEVDFLQFKKF